MSEYKTRLSLERQLIKKINTWFPDVKLMGLSIDSLKRWISTNFQQIKVTC
jgi:UDP-N-acetyl-D-mannosaminuronic acid transferase (WecB/TagA/CpsF family)